MTVRIEPFDDFGSPAYRIIGVGSVISWNRDQLDAVLVAAATLRGQERDAAAHAPEGPRPALVEDYKLCFVRDMRHEHGTMIAHFTLAPEREGQDGVNWSEPGYETIALDPNHNYAIYRDGVPVRRVDEPPMQVLFEPGALLAAHELTNEPVSVGFVNSGGVPWLATVPEEGGTPTSIEAGLDPITFRWRVEQAGGRVLVAPAGVGTSA